MGATYSKAKNINFITYNCQIRFFSIYKSNRLLNYILNLKENNVVICLQGLYDKKTIKYLESNLLNINFIKTEKGLITLSSYDISNPVEIIFDIDESYKKMFNSNKGFLSVDISINNKLLSIYNIELQEEIDSNFSINEIRCNQIKQLLFYIFERKKIETENKLHIILGALYLNKIEENNFFDLMDNFKKNIITNIDNNTKEDFILLFTDSKKDSKYITKFMHDSYNIKVIDVDIRTEMNFSKNLPCELLFKIDNKNNPKN